MGLGPHWRPVEQPSPVALFMAEFSSRFPWQTANFVESADPRLRARRPILQQSLAYDFAVSALGCREPAFSSNRESYQIRDSAGLL